MSTAAEPFTTCHYCELDAETKHKTYLRRAVSGLLRTTFIYACFLHKEEAEREARRGRLLLNTR